MTRPTIGSLFAGVGGFDMGFEQAGFEVAWQVEIDKDAVSVLERHYPNVPRVRDIREAGANNLAPVDVIAGGFPCQDLSVAGKRAGLAGTRSGLFWELIRIVREMLEATDGRYPAFVVVENVPGLLSSHGGRDFAAVLSGLRECGAAVGYRVLDARFRGVPQRRRRVFVVAGFAGGHLRAQRTAEVLSLFEGSRRDSEACREAGEGAPGDAEDGAGGVGEPRAFRQNLAGHIFESEVMPPLRAGATGGMNQPTVGVPLVASEPIVYQCHGNNVGAIGTLRQGNGGLTGGVPFVASTSGQGWWNEGPGALRVDAGGMEQSSHLVVGALPSGVPPLGHGTAGVNNQAVNAGHIIPVMAAGAHGANGAGISVAGSPMFSLDTTGAQAVAISENQQAELRETPYANALATSGGKIGQGYQAVREGMAVRRLTPRECERLMGWEDDRTRYRGDGSEIPDGPRYRMIGNGVVAPVARWLGERLFRALMMDSQHGA